MSRVEAIMERVNDRTRSMINDDDPTIIGAVVEQEDSNVMFVGLPLTANECEEYVESLHLNVIEMALRGIPVQLGMAALFRHAVMFGLLAHTVDEFVGE